MTIETRISFPQGGLECPPNGNPVLSNLESSPMSTSSTSSNNSSDSSPDVGSSANPAFNEISKPANQKGQKLRRLQCTSTIQLTSSNAVDNVAIESQSDSSINAVSTCSEGINYLLIRKPSNKGHTKQIGEGSKVETSKARTSRRLRLRRGEYMEVRRTPPRYVEDDDLKKIDFENEEIKVKFMGALGMTHQNSDMKRHTVKSCSTSAGNIKFESDANSTSSQPITIRRIADCTTVSSIDFKLQSRIKLSDDETSHHDELDEGWVPWETRLPLQQSISTSQNGKAPLTFEIDAAVQRLLLLGTGVRTATGIY